MNSRPTKLDIRVADDHPIRWQCLDFVLRFQGLTVGAPFSGPEDMDWSHQHHDAIALVLMDIQTPGPGRPANARSPSSLDPRCPLLLHGG